MQPHKHAEVIKAWADGLPCQFRLFPGEEWMDMTRTSIRDVVPMFDPEWEYRIKPTTRDEQTDDSTGIVEVSE